MEQRGISLEIVPAFHSSTEVDRFRIKILDNDNGNALVYDNQVECGGEGADHCTGIGGGNIVIHTAKDQTANVTRASVSNDNQREVIHLPLIMC